MPRWPGFMTDTSMAAATTVTATKHTPFPPTPLAAPLHPYYPVNVPIPHYAANEDSVSSLLVQFGALIACVITIAVVAARKTRPAIGIVDQLVVAWFALCGFLHIFFEGYFVFNHGSLAGLQTLFAQLWKEYAKSDSRYLTSDPFMLCVETITVFVWGPLCWAIAYCIAKRPLYRHPLQIIMCIGHLYGVLLYYSTSLAESSMHGVSHSRPEFLFFWIYYIGLNSPWLIIPAVLLYHSVMHIKHIELDATISEIIAAISDDEQDRKRVQKYARKRAKKQDRKRVQKYARKRARKHAKKQDGRSDKLNVKTNDKQDDKQDGKNDGKHTKAEIELAELAELTKTEKKLDWS